MGEDKINTNEELMQFLETEELQGIFNEYRDASEMAESAGFNVFTMISDYYYRENFHGDILKACLDPKGEHGEGDKFLKIFIEMLGVGTDKYGPSTTVEREVGLTGEAKGRIDFVIKNNDESEPHCIIIENKLYDAIDMPEQLPRYFEEMTNRRMQEVDKIAYLPLSVGKRPEDLSEEVDNLLKVVPAVNVSDSKCSLIDNWIDPCIEVASNLDCISILRQYKRLLISLKPEMTKYKSIMDLYEYLKKDNNFEKVLAAKNMLNNLGNTLAIRLIEKLRESKPAGENGRKICLNNGYSIWIYCGAENLDYTMRVVDADNNPISIDWLPDDCLKNELNDRIDDKGYGRYIHFRITEEDKLINAVQTIVEAANMQTNIIKDK